MVPGVQEAGLPQGDLDGWKISPPTGIRYQDGPTHRESLYRLCYPGLLLEGGVGVLRHLFLTWAPVASELSASRPYSLLPCKKPLVPSFRRQVGPHSRSGHFGEGKISFPRQDVNLPPPSSAWTIPCVGFSVYAELHVANSES
jgi:hypothetical protein